MQVEHFIQSFSNRFLDSLNLKISLIGEADFFVLLFWLIFYFKGRKDALGAGSIFYFSNAGNAVLKEIFRVPRAFGQLDIRVVGASEISGYSFPSGHVQNTATMAGILSSKTARKVWKIALGVIVFLVAFSRIYLGAHTIWDVIGGTLAGYGIAFFGAYIFEKRECTKKEWVLLIFPGILLVSMFLQKIPRLYTSSMLCMMLIIGYYLEIKFFHSYYFKSVVAKIIGCVLSVGLFRYVNELSSSLGESTSWGYLLRGFIPGVFLGIVVPVVNVGIVLFFQKVLHKKI